MELSAGGLHLNKKPKKPQRDGGDEKISLEMITLSALERGLAMTDIRRTTLGQIVDFVIEYNNRNEKDERPKRVKATQADINAFFGG